jgi:hypothetical protein
VADRIRPRPLLVVSQLFHACLAAALALVAFAGPHALWPVYLISLLNSVVTAIDGPALGRFGSMVVRPASLSGARTALVFAGAVCLLACAVAAALLARLTAATTRRDRLYSRTSSGHQPPGLTRSPGYVRSSQPITTMSAVSAEASTDSPMTVIPKAAS